MTLLRRHGLPAGISTLLAVGTGALTNIATAQWQPSLAAGLGVLVVGYVGFEAWRSTRQASEDQQPPMVFSGSGSHSIYLGPVVAPPAAATGATNPVPPTAAIAVAEGSLARAVPRVRNVAPRNPGFAGRDDLITRLHERLAAGGTTVVQALHGMGGVGKTQLVIEYVYRFESDYDVVWWISAEQPELIGDQFSALGVELGLAGADTDAPTAARALRSYLRQHDRWLLVFDNANDPAHLREWLPDGHGHVIVTSRLEGWNDLAAPVEIGVLTRAESISLLRSYHPRLEADDAAGLAEALGDLPLALAQAAGFLAETGMRSRDYIDLLASRATQLLGEGPAGAYPRTLAATVLLASTQLTRVDPAALAVLRLCAFFAPEPVPAEWFSRPPEDDGSVLRPLALAAGNIIEFRRSMARVASFGLAKVDVAGVQMHRLIQAIVRDQLADGERDVVRRHVEAVLTSNSPGDPADPPNWSGWGRLLPHLLAVEPARSDDPMLRQMICDACWYLLARGDATSAEEIAEELHRYWIGRFGEDHEDTLYAAACLARSYRDQGKHDIARTLDADILARRVRVLGQDAPLTLRSASNLALDLHALEDIEQARQLNQDTLERRRRTLGDNHPNTLTSASHLAADIREAGDIEAALALDQDTLTRRREVLGDNHPNTLISANNVASDLHLLGRFDEALVLNSETLQHRRQILGDQHPNTLNSARNLATNLHALGDSAQARRIEAHFSLPDTRPSRRDRRRPRR
ncbi:FxSxx-COOH system tetratricopeptide repeat protein [Dactylosporangium cerinum]|uniref:FxSxx-COOH system tetratricopeptide repeat protein n=1 Tax=Dactylosporangium cerinum TaxID=1434730 RepID=A0ABV9WAV2_9ACTN